MYGWTGSNKLTLTIVRGFIIIQKIFFTPTVAWTGQKDLYLIVTGYILQRNVNVPILNFINASLAPVVPSGNNDKYDFYLVDLMLGEHASLSSRKHYTYSGYGVLLFSVSGETRTFYDIIIMSSPR